MISDLYFVVSVVGRSVWLFLVVALMLLRFLLLHCLFVSVLFQFFLLSCSCLLFGLGVFGRSSL